MVEELKGLIEKINREGIKAAQGKAVEIEADARRKAERIVDDAGRQAESGQDAGWYKGRAGAVRKGYAACPEERDQCYA
ncbi:hypothetical protein ACFL1K_05620 [Candidatus Omnitrophota bacterium]